MARRILRTRILQTLGGAMTALGCLAFAVLPALAGEKVAVFPFDLIDDSQEGEADGLRADQTARLKLIGDELIKLLKADGRYEPVDMSAQAGEIAKQAPIYKCNGCEDAIAKAAGADKALICTVQKVSNLILNLNLFVRDVKAEKTTRAMSVDIRGNTDDTWLHAVRYIVKNQLLAEEIKR